MRDYSTIPRTNIYDKTYRVKKKKKKIGKKTKKPPIFQGRLEFLKLGKTEFNHRSVALRLMGPRRQMLLVFHPARVHCAAIFRLLPSNEE